MAWRGRIRTALLLAGVMLATTGLDYFDIDEFECEQAVAHLADCCPQLDPTTIDCTIGACDTSDFDRAESECIQSLDCAELESRGLCDFVPSRSTSFASSTSGGDEPICR